MKKIVLVIITLFLVGCTNINDYTYEDVLATVATPANRANVFRTGYKYYLPNKMQVASKLLFNEVLDDGDDLYYLYIDAVSYYNKENIKSDKCNICVYVKSIVNDKYTGYIQVKLYDNDKYLVEIMYNYAKIEVMVDSKNLNKSMLNAISILKSIEYNDSIIENILGKDVLNFSEENFDIFKTKTDDSNYIQSKDDMTETKDVVIDPDLIN